MVKYKEYIPSPQYWKEMFSRASRRGEWTPVDRVSLEHIKVDKHFFSYQNDIDHAQAIQMLVSFAPSRRIPITVNEDYYLLDGQHRLQVA